MRLFIIASFLLLTLALEWFQQNNPHFLLGPVFNETIKDPTHCKFIKFFTPWCRYCRVLKDIIDSEKQTTYANSTDVKFYEVNCHASPDICMPFQIHSVPMIMLIDRNGETKQTATGVYPKEWYEEVINNNCQTPKPAVQPEAPVKQNGESEQNKPIIKKGLTRHTQQPESNNDNVKNDSNTQKQKENIVSKPEKDQTVQKPVETAKQDGKESQVNIPTNAPQHSAAEQHVKQTVVEKHIKQDTIGNINKQTHKSDEMIGVPQTKSHKGQSWKTFLLLAFAFVICFFLHNKYCNQNRNNLAI